MLHRDAKSRGVMSAHGAKKGLCVGSSLSLCSSLPSDKARPYLISDKDVAPGVLMRQKAL